MSQIFEPGQKVRTDSSGMVCVVEQFLGGGGQGEVYRAKLADKSVALKWYFPDMATLEQRSALQTLVMKGAPNDKFLWPMEMASAPGVEGFGYIMALRDPRFHGIVDLVKRRIDPSFRSVITAGLELAGSFLELHSKGLCYRDISFGNVFFDPKTGEILICDNDNVCVNGTPSGTVLGTPRFMAPEVVRGDAYPSTETDLFSLAILLFYMLMIHHPLEGKREAEIHCFDLPAMNKLYGTEPLFIFDPNDESNRPVPGQQDNALIFWPIYPQSVRELFTQTFTAGIQDPKHSRVRESEWRAAMARLRDSVLYCPDCGAEAFYDIDMLKAQGKLNPCWSCQKELKIPPRMRIGDHIVMLNTDTRLFPHHVDTLKLYDFSQPIAQVVQHPSSKDVWGLKNLTDKKWQVIADDGDTKTVPPQRSVTLTGGTKIDFGTTEGEIRA